MTTVTVKASKTYDVTIGAGLLATAGEALKKIIAPPARVMLMTDDTVEALYAAKLTATLVGAGYTVTTFAFPHGEASKNTSTLVEMWEAMARAGLTRTDFVAALGGGVVGDMAGFAAATYLRGIPYVQVPTTLLAAVDSSVGGKTAIDLPAGKNLCGAFCQPRLVLCDTDTLTTLPAEVFRDGCAEVIKYAILYDPDFFDYLRKSALDFDREAVIARCVELKRDVVMADEFDTGARMKLNLGHTIGHGVEAGSNFALSHGKSVAIGIAIVARAAAAMGMCTVECSKKIQNLLKDFGLPVDTEYSPEELFACALSDKKRSGSSVRLIIPREIGRCDIVPTPVSELTSFIEAGL